MSNLFSNETVQIVAAVNARHGFMSRLSVEMKQAGMKTEIAAVHEPEEQQVDSGKSDELCAFWAGLYMDQLAKAGFKGRLVLQMPARIARRAFEVQKLHKSGWSLDEAINGNGTANGIIKPWMSEGEFASRDMQDGLMALAQGYYGLLDGGAQVRFVKTENLTRWLAQDMKVAEAAGLVDGQKVQLKNGVLVENGKPVLFGGKSLSFDSGYLNGEFEVTVREGNTFTSYSGKQMSVREYGVKRQPPRSNALYNALTVLNKAQQGRMPQVEAQSAEDMESQMAALFAA